MREIERRSFSNVEMKQNRSGGSSCYTAANSNAHNYQNQCDEQHDKERQKRVSRSTRNGVQVKATIEIPCRNMNAVVSESECNSFSSSASISAGTRVCTRSSSRGTVQNSSETTPTMNNVSTMVSESGSNSTSISSASLRKLKLDMETMNRTPHNLLSSPSPRKSNVVYFAPTQMIAEEIERTEGTVFQNLDQLPKEHFISAPGVRVRLSNKTRRSSNAQKGTKRRKRGRNSIRESTNQSEHQSEEEIVQHYCARTTYAGVSVNLGSDHHSTISAAAALDIANKLYWGGENERPCIVLSEGEVMKALDAIGYGTSLHPDEFISTLFTQERKNYFEKLVELALSSLGGRDDYYADLLCGIEIGGHRKRASTEDKHVVQSWKSKTSNLMACSDSPKNTTIRREPRNRNVIGLKICSRTQEEKAGATPSRKAMRGDLKSPSEMLSNGKSREESRKKISSPIEMPSNAKISKESRKTKVGNLKSSSDITCNAKMIKESQKKKANKLKQTNEIPNNYAKAKAIKLKPTSEIPEMHQSSMQHIGNHVVFDIDDNGLFSWRLDDSI